MTRHPFALVGQRIHLVANFTLEGEPPPLSELLQQLLRHHPPEEVLLLRPLSRAEHRLLLRSREGAEVEAWAQMVVKEEDRSRPRGGRR